MNKQDGHLGARGGLQAGLRMSPGLPGRDHNCPGWQGGLRNAAAPRWEAAQEALRTELEQLARLATDDFTLDSRMMLDVTVQRDRDIIFHELCLNDAVITKGAVARIVHLNVDCDGVQAMECGGDGIVVATPTGSTAYSLSAGGPIVEPDAGNILITPICAHDIGSRCIVVSDKRRITVQLVKNARRNAFLSVDGGKALRLNMGDVTTVRKSERVTKLIRLKNRSFFDVIHTKFKNNGGAL